MRTHCVNGHELTPENSHLRYTRGRPWIACRVCAREVDRRYSASEKGRQRLREMKARRAGSVQKAYDKIRNRILSGTLVQQPCQDCGASPAAAHHPRGYEGTAALDIEWLCRTHHTARHRKTVAA